MRINLNNIVEFEKNDNDALPIYPSLFGENVVFGINIKSKKNNLIKKGIIVNYNINNQSVLWEKHITEFSINGIRTKAKLLGNTIIICLDYALFALDYKTGETKWKKVFKNNSDPEISFIQDRLFFSNWGEIQELNIKTGTKIISKKPRVKWFDSELIELNKRLFVSTSNSKILELSPNNLDVINEYKYPGGWAIACKPFLHNNQLISSSYGNKIIIFDLDSNLPIKKFNKKSGSKPQQLKIGTLAFFYEGHLDNKLTCINLINFTKKWKVEFDRIQDIQKVKDKLLIIFKEKNIYVVAEIDKNNGKYKKIIEKSIYDNWSDYQWDLWEGVSIESNDYHQIYAYEPNRITIKSA